MKTGSIVFSLLFGVCRAFGDAWHVSPSGDDSAAGQSWETARQSIQSAVESAADGDSIFVASGIYAPISAADKVITIQSTGGPFETIIDGGLTARCATLGADTVVNGFTLRNGGGVSYGGGAYFGHLINCVLTENSAKSGGGSWYSLLENCLVTGNKSSSDGGGACQGNLVNCTITGNTAGGKGGGSNGGTLTNCIVWGNVASAPAFDNRNGGVFTYSCSPGLAAENGNLGDGAYPGFIAPQRGDYRLSSLSVCAGLGDPGLLPPAADINGDSLFTGGRINIGAMSTAVEAPQPKALYVDAQSGDDAAGDGLSAATAYRSIQRAILSATPGSTITATAGSYSPIATLSLPVTIRSIGGAAATIIDGGGTNRCATLGASSSRLEGFTLLNGSAPDGGGALGGTLENCVLTGNTATASGGAVYHSTLADCILRQNTAATGGAASYSSLTRCRLAQNTASSHGGASYYSALSACILNANASGGSGGGAYYGALTNCTVSANTSTSNGGGTYYSELRNAIVCGNTKNGATNDRTAGAATYCYIPGVTSGTGNISGTDPRFANAPGGDFRLLSDSPCLATGNPAFTGDETDLNGVSLYSDGRISIGAMGAHGQGTTQNTPAPIPHTWLDAYYPSLENALAYETAALSDSDADRFPAWQEYVLGTIPTDPDSRFILNLTIDAETPVVTWEPVVSGRRYALQGKETLQSPAWTLLDQTTAGYRFFRVLVTLE